MSNNVFNILRLKNKNQTTIVLKISITFKLKNNILCNAILRINEFYKVIPEFLLSGF